MSNKRLAIFVIAFLLCGCVAGYDTQEITQEPINLLQNPGFEGGWTHTGILYWDLSGGPYSWPIFGNIFSPQDWTSGWREGFACPCGPDFTLGRPEVQVIDKTADSSRVRSGEQAAKLFTFWRCHFMWLSQQVAVDIGAKYDFEIYAHSWYSRCSTKPYEPPLDTDCITPLVDSWDHLRAGIDPTGGLDPTASTVIWGEAIEQYGHYYQSIEVRNVRALSTTITVFFKAENNYPLKHNDVYVDDAILTPSPPMVYLPFIIKVN